MSFAQKFLLSSLITQQFPIFIGTVLLTIPFHYGLGQVHAEHAELPLTWAHFHE